MAKELPILFTVEMVKAIREGRKSVTRRVIKLPYRAPPLRWEYDGISGDEHAFVLTNGTTNYDYHFVKPRYNVGDLLWVKETWAYYPDENHVVYKAREGIELEQQGIDLRGCWKSSRFMFKKFARTWLEVVSVRPERLRDMAFNDIRREGLECPEHDFDGGFCCSPCKSLAKAFIYLWDSINAKRGYSWESNPWVWRIEFKEYSR